MDSEGQNSDDSADSAWNQNDELPMTVNQGPNSTS